MTNLVAVKQFIHEASEEALDSIVDAVKARRSIIAREAVNLFQVGQKVTWKKHGATHEGTIQCLNSKSITVLEERAGNIPNVRWRIHPSFLSVWYP